MTLRARIGCVVLLHVGIDQCDIWRAQPVQRRPQSRTAAPDSTQAPRNLSACVPARLFQGSSVVGGWCICTELLSLAQGHRQTHGKHLTQQLRACQRSSCRHGGGSVAVSAHHGTIQRTG